MKKILTYIFFLLMVLPAAAQVDRHDVRSGNRKFRKGDYKNAEIDYRKATVRDSTSIPAQYDLASAMYRQEKFNDAQKAFDAISEAAPESAYASKYHFNRGDVALKNKDYATAVDAFRQALLITPDDLDAKENYIYAKLMLQNQQNGGGGGNGQNNQDNQNDQDNKDPNQDQDQNQNQDQPNQGQDPQDGQPQEQKISPQQAQQMLKAIQAKEKETQDKVNKEKAALLKSRQKEKNW